MKTELETRDALTVEVLSEEPVSVELWNGDRLRQAAGVKPDATIWDAVKILEPERGDFLAPTVCLVDDKPVMRAEWDKPIGQRKVMFCELPLGGGDGGSNAAMLVQILTTVLALACYFIPVVGPWIALGVQLVGTLIAGMLATNAMGQRDASGAEAASPTYSINASGNEARLFQPEPEGFGRMKIVPDYVGQTWARFQDNEQYAHFLFGLGRGSYDVEACYWGDSLFWSKDGGFTSMATGGGDPYSAKANEELAAVASGEAPWCNPIPICGDGGTATTGSVTVSFPRGHGWWAYNAPADAPPAWKYTAATASFELQWGRINSDGSIAWYDSDTVSFTAGNDSAVSTGDADSAGVSSIAETAKGKAFVYRFRFSLPPATSQYPNPRWAIRARNVTGIISATPVQGYSSTAVFQSAVISQVSSAAWATAIQIVEPGDEVTLFSTNVVSSSEVSSLAVPAPNDDDYSGWVGPYAVNPPGTTARRIMVDWSLPGGLGQYTDEGGYQWYSVDLELQAQQIDDAGQPLPGAGWFNPGGSGDTDRWTVSDRTTTPQRRTRIYSVNAGRYQVRMRRTNNTDKYNTTWKSVDDVQWTGLKAALPGQLRFPQTVIAVKVLATNVLSQQASQNFSVVATRKLPKWNMNTHSWSEPVATQSWAAALCAICQEPWGGCLPDSQLDLETIWEIDEALQEMGWGFNAYIDGHYNLWNLIVEACQAVCCMPRMQGTVLSVVRDNPGRPVSYELSARNIVRGSFQVTYQTWTEDTPDDVIMNYMDEDALFQKRDVQAILPASESAEPVTLDWIGITGREQAFRVGVRYAAMNRYRRVSVTCQVEALGKLIQAGDVVSVNHPRFRETRAGVVTGWNAETLVINIDKDFESGIESSVIDQYISMTRPDGSIWGPVKGDVTWEGHAFVLDGSDYADWLAGGGDAPWSWLTAGDDIQPTAYALHTARTFSRRMLVQSVVPEDAGHFTLTLCNDAEQVSSFDNLPVPTWNARANANAVLSPPASLSVTFNDGGTVARAAWSSVDGAPQYEVHHSTDGTTWTHLGVVTGSRKTFSVSSAALTGVRVRAVSPSAVSDWKVWTPSS